MTGQEPAHHHRFPERMAFLLNNPIRRRLDPPERLIAKLQIGSNDTVVDFGCGPGFNTIPLARTVRKVIGVDISPRMLEKARRRAENSGVAVVLIQSDGTRLDLADGTVDLILLNHVFHEIEDKHATLSEFVRVLRSSGRLAIVEKTGRRGLFDGFGPPIIDPKEVERELAAAGFDSIQSIPHGHDSIILGRKPQKP